MPRRPHTMTAPQAPPALATRTWVAASPALSLAFVLALSFAFPALWPKNVAEHLQTSVTFELVAIHSFFFFIIPIALQPKKWWHHVLRWSWVGLLVAFYTGMALQSSEGLKVLPDMAVLLASTYGAVLLRKPSDNRLAMMIVRWLYCFISFALVGGMVVSVFGDGERALYAIGALYFAALGLLDSLNGFERFVLWRQQRVRRRR